jgi:putative component of membrane protein insertase Oxa1/YidC/SpoIIIJ protein YidD
MPIRLCARGHITGYRRCVRCKGNALHNVGGDPIPVRMDKRYKRAITQALREAGIKPAADYGR